MLLKKTIKHLALFFFRRYMNQWSCNWQPMAKCFFFVLFFKINIYIYFYFCPNTRTYPMIYKLTNYDPEDQKHDSIIFMKRYKLLKMMHGKAIHINNFWLIIYKNYFKRAPIILYRDYCDLNARPLQNVWKKEAKMWPAGHQTKELIHFGRL